MKKRVLSILLAMGMLLCLLPVTAGAASTGWMSECKPYQYTNATEYLPKNEDTFTIGGTAYNEGYTFYLWNAARTSQVLYNLKGEYSNFTFFAGHVDNTSLYTAKLKIYLDGELTQTVELTSSDIAKKVSVDLDGVQQLKIVMASDEALNHYDIYYGVYGGVFTKNGTTAPEIPASNMVNNCEPYQVSEVTVIRDSDGKSFAMGGDTYTDCLQFYLWNPSRKAKAYFNFNGNYESITFLFGHIDNTSRYDATLTIEVDGEVVQTIDQEADSLPVEVTVPLKDAYQMVLTLSSSQAYNTYDYYYGIGAIQLKSNGAVTGILLDKDTLSLTENNPAAYLRATIIPNDADNQNITWSSSDTSVATVNENGLVKGVSSGTATITATTQSGGYQASCVVTVDLPDPCADGHTWDAGTVTKEATCAEDGEMTYTCTVCGETRTEIIPKLGNPFEDVGENEYYYDPVLWAVDNSITTGTTSTTFSPLNDCTRGQIVTFLWRAAGSPNPVSDYNPFTDVQSNQYYYTAVLWAVEKGITRGTSETIFSPDDGCTRAQVVTFLYRFEGSPEVGSVNNPFTDVGDTWYTASVLWAVEKSVTSGTTTTTFSPNDTCTRGQIVTFLYRDMKQ